MAAKPNRAVRATLLTPWASDGSWAADGAYVRFVPTLAMLVWLAAVSRYLMRLSASTVSTPKGTAVPA